MSLELVKQKGRGTSRTKKNTSVVGNDIHNSYCICCGPKQNIGASTATTLGSST